MKFFSFISEREVRIAPKKKVVPEKEYSRLVEAEELLTKAKEEALAYRKKVAKECELLKAAASEEGFQEGLLQLNKHLLALDHLVKNLHDEIHKKILPLSLTAARKILGEELKIHPDRIVDIVLQSLKPVTQNHKVTIYVHRSDLEVLEKKKSAVKKILEQVESFSLQERDDIEPGGCIIETEAGIINAQLENQWRAMESAFEAFMKKIV